MPIIRFLRPSGVSIDLDVPLGETLMHAATHAGLDEIVAECGGHLACGTCHVHIAGPWAAACPPMTDGEDQMLEFTAAPRDADSRLSCQLVMNEAMAGAEVRIASPQV